MNRLSASDFDFELPEEQIAHRPVDKRDDSRLLLVLPNGVADYVFSSLPDLIERHVGKRVLVVVNDSRVLWARLAARKFAPDGSLGGRVELLFLEPATQGGVSPVWRALVRTSKPLREGAKLQLLARTGEPLLGETLTVQKMEEEGRALFSFSTASATTWLSESPGLASQQTVDDLLSRAGTLPLPPYIEKKRRKMGADCTYPDDQDRYQTVYAKTPGSVAAPTAGLHFTPELLLALARRGIETAPVTLHVGPGTFLPLRADDPEKHVMHAERYFIPETTSAAIRQARQEGRKVLAVGTTVVRTLESAMTTNSDTPQPGWGQTQLFIWPQGPTQRYPFRAVDALLTNFHLPRSTLLMLVAAFAGTHRILSAYQHAVAAGYRFFSFGDAMLLPGRM